MLKFRVLGYFICLIALYFTVQSALGMLNFVKLGGKTRAQNFQYTIENRSEKFYVHATYQIGTHLIESDLDEPFLNEWAAEQAALKIQKNPQVFVNPNDLSYSSLQKVFPIKQLAYTLVLWALGGYFILFQRLIGYDSRAQKR